jgi:hypothetical protein
MSTERESTVELAMLLLEVPLSDEAAAQLTAALWCEALETLRFTAQAEDTVETTPGGALLVTPSAGGTLALMPIAVPIPVGDLQPFAQGTPVWPEAGEAIAAHQAHALVTWLGGPEDPAKRKTLFALAVAATAELLEASGVYASPVCFSTATWGAVARGAWEGEPPVPLWVNVDAIGIRGGRGSALTDGLERFGHRDLHVTTPGGPGDAWEQAMAIASYIINAHAVIEPGQTIGSSEDERVEVVLADAPDGSDRKVLRMDYP